MAGTNKCRVSKKMPGRRQKCRSEESIFAKKKRKKQKEKRQKVAKLGVCENMREKQQEVVGIVADE